MVNSRYLEVIFCIVFFGISQLSFAQNTGPGGVGTSATNIIWLDASQLSLSNGDAVSSWTDISGNDNNFIQGTPANQPNFNSSGMNSKATVTFNGSSDILISDHLGSSAISDLDTDVLTYFLVFQNTSTLPTPTDEKYGMVLASRSSANNIEWAFQLKRENASKIAFERYARKSGGAGFAISTSLEDVGYNQPNIVNGAWKSNDNITGLVNAGNSGTAAGANSSGFTHVGTYLGAALDATDVPVRYFEGEIAEIIVYSGELNTAQEKIIYNYLSAKYNLTLDNYVIYAFNSSHREDVAGIGREDASNVHLSAQGSGEVSMTIGSLDIADYMIWGHDGSGFGVSTSNIPSAYLSSTGNRISQEWIVTEQGDLSDNGDITLTFDISGNEFGDDDEYQLLINQNGDNDWTDADTITGTYAGGIITFTVPAGDLIDGSKFSLGNKQKTIISIVDGQNWNQSSTWSCSCIPLEGNNVTVDLGHTVTVTDAQAVNDLIITGTLSFDNGADFDIKGDVTSTGSFTMNSSSNVTLSGTTGQILDFTGTVTFDNLELDNSNGALLNSGSFSFASSLLVTDGDLDFNNNSVTFLSSASGTAAIGPISGSISGLTNNVTSQRFIGAGSAGWSEVGFPFMADCDLTEWDDEMFMSGPINFDDGCAYSGNGCFNSATYWDPSADGGNGANVGINDATMQINQGVGIDLFMGDDLNTWSDHTLIVDNRTINLTLSEEITTLDGWNFIANPFLCPVDFDQATLSNVASYYWIYDAEDGWLYYDAGGPPFTNSGSINMFNGIISSYQGFWVFSSGAGSVTFDQSCKSMSSSDEFLKSGTYTGNDYLTIVLNKENSLSPPSRVYLNLSQEKASNDYFKLPTRPMDFNLFARDVDGYERSLMSLVGLNECKRIPLGIEGVTDGDYKFSFQNIPSKFDVFLLDKLSGEKFELGTNVELNFNLTALDESRFSLILSNKASNCELNSYDDFNIQVSSISNGFSVFLDKPIDSYSVLVTDMLGKQVYQSNIISNESMKSEHYAVFQNGTYIVSIIDDNGIIISSEKFISIN